MEGPNHEDFQRVGERIRENVEKANELLSNAKIESDVVSHEERISKILDIKQSDFIRNEPSSECYDLDRVKKLFEMMEIKPENLESRPDTRKRIKNLKADSYCNLTMAALDSTFLPPRALVKPTLLTRSESVTSTKSLASTASNEDVTSSGDSREEIKSRIRDIRQTLESITNGYIAYPDLKQFEAKTIAMDVHIYDATFKINRLLKELRSIASSVDSQPTRKVPGVDDALIQGLEQLNQTLNNIETSSSNPIGEHLKPEDCTFQLNKSINRILEAFENNPLN